MENAGPSERNGEPEVNTLGGRGISTNVLLCCGHLQTIARGRRQASDIVVWDRDSNELERAGFHLAMAESACNCYGTDRVGYEEIWPPGAAWAVACQRYSRNAPACLSMFPC